MNKSMMVYFGVAFELTGFLLAGYFLGNYLDQKFVGRGLYLALAMMGSLVLWVARIYFFSKFIKK